MLKLRITAGVGAALLVVASLRAGEPAPRDDDRGKVPVAQQDRSRGFYGFPDWDSRSGG